MTISYLSLALISGVKGQKQFSQERNLLSCITVKLFNMAVNYETFHYAN